VANIWGLTNRQLMARTLRQLVEEAEANQGLVSPVTLEQARVVLSEVVRNKRPQTLPKLKPSKQIVDF
jgi:hypothetical protein